jgi:hypothetical protein
MKSQAKRTVKVAAAAALLAAMLGAPAWAGDDKSTTPPADETAAPPPANQTYELKDNADSPPVNYRSNEDERYNNPQQRDAEMYAEQYEQKRKEEQERQKRLLDNVNKLRPGGGRVNGSFGGTDDGFPSRSPY